MEGSQAKIYIRDLEMAFFERRTRTRTLALEGVNLTVGDGEFVCLLGPSGCGKSTILNVVAGFLKPTRGKVLIAGAPVVGPSPDHGVVFQDASLFPWLSVWKNITFGPRMRKLATSAYEGLARQYMAQVGLAGFENHLPIQLSGGMQQRVAIARVLVNNPAVLLMDEPFGALDAQTRLIMQELLLRLWDAERKTVLFITHDIEEAILLADRIFIMTARPGKIKRVIDVELARPRGYESIASPAFIALKREVLAVIRDESLAALAQES
jgi:NitT/TauT family transport system ATP-binding protein